MAAYPEHTRDISHFDTLPDSAMLRLPAVLALTGHGRSSWYEQVAAGLAPKPVRIGPRATAWRVGDLRAWLAACQAEPYAVDKAVVAALAARGLKHKQLI